MCLALDVSIHSRPPAKHNSQLSYSPTCHYCQTLPPSNGVKLTKPPSTSLWFTGIPQDHVKAAIGKHDHGQRQQQQNNDAEDGKGLRRGVDDGGNQTMTVAMSSVGCPSGAWSNGHLLLAPHATDAVNYDDNCHRGRGALCPPLSGTSHPAGCPLSIRSSTMSITTLILCQII